MAHQIVIGLGGNGFRAICSCGWRTGANWDRAVIIADSGRHKKLQIIEGEHTGERDPGRPCADYDSTPGGPRICDGDGRSEKTPSALRRG